MIITHKNITPQISSTAFIAPSADIIGQVRIGENSSVWFQSVLRGDLEPITIGKKTNIQDHSMIHTTRGFSQTVIGDEVSIGHRALLHGCILGNRILVGMGAIIMDNVVIEDDCLIAAGTLLTKGTKIPRGSLVIGSPGKVVRPLNEQELSFLVKSAQNYHNDLEEYRKIHLPAHLQV